MNKTIIININGTVFHIEEQAYELLKEYMTDVKRHFLNSADSLEITTDIENRIAEMFTEILAREGRQAIIDQDVAAVIEQMGSVKDFETAEESNNNTGFAESTFTPGGSRRLFRDPEDHLIGGVCAGIANYFEIPSLWVRLFFAIAFVFAGTGFLVYVILWIIVPKAITRADRMTMKGEPLDLQGFKRNFEAELSSVGNHLAGMHREARPLIYKTRDFVSDFFHHLGIFFSGAGKIIIKLLGIAIILLCIAGIIAIIVTLVATSFFGERNFSLPDVFFSYPYINQVRVAVALVTIIPLATLIVIISSAIFNTASVGRSAGYTLLIIWISSLVVLIYHGARTAAEFRDSAGFTQTINLKPNAKQVYYLQLNETMFLTSEDSSRLDIKNKFNNMVLTNENDDEDFDPKSMNIDIERSDVPYPILVEEFTARGADYENALSNARNTRYIFVQQDSILKFDRKLRRLNIKQWHGEEVRLTLRIPLNATIMVNHDINRYISNYLDINDCRPDDRKYTRSEPAAFIMTEEGLKCKFERANKEPGIREERVTVTDTLKADTTLVTVDTVANIDTTVVVTTRKIIKPGKRQK
jgi:phage shock protein PspC (stress-responsive transcriptional regulator)